MKIIQEALTSELLEEVNDYFNDNIGEHAWRSGSVTWPMGIKQGVTHSPLIQDLPDELGDKVSKEIKASLPKSIIDKTIKTDCQICMWERLASLSSHNDEKYTFATTIYLNKEWAIDNGGLFVWQELGQQTLRAFVPSFNSAVINDKDELHLVTPVSVFTHEPRYSIQLWGIGKETENAL